MDPELKTIKALFKQLKRSPPHTFPALWEKLQAPVCRGVYVIYNPQGEVVHVGRTPRAINGIAQRLRAHMSGASSFTEGFLEGNGHELRDRYTYRCLVVPNTRHRALLEAYATGQLCPIHLGVENDIP